MPRLPSVKPADAPAAVAEMLADYGRRTGREPGPMVRGMAVSEALLRGYMDLSRAMKRADLDRAVGERISLAVQETLGCDYCLEAHAAAARKAGLSEDDIAMARRGTATEPRVAALVAFGQAVATRASEITDGDVDRLRELGWGDEQVAEVVGLVALNVLTGTFNLVAGIHAGQRAEG